MRVYVIKCLVNHYGLWHCFRFEFLIDYGGLSSRSVIGSGVFRNAVWHLTGSFGELTYILSSSRPCGIVDASYDIFSLFHGLALLMLGILKFIKINVLERIVLRSPPIRMMQRIAPILIGFDDLDFISGLKRMLSHLVSAVHDDPSSRFWLGSYVNGVWSKLRESQLFECILCSQSSGRNLYILIHTCSRE